MKKARLVGTQREKLIVALVAEDALVALNTVFKTRGLTFTLDYTGPNPWLYISRPGVEPELLMAADPRTKHCSIFVPHHPELRSAYVDLIERLASIEARLILVTQKDKQQRKWAKLQLHVVGSRTTALTILDINRGQKISDTEFCLPGEKP